MKKISVVIPTYNEEKNVKAICAAVINQLSFLSLEYDYEILLIDNHSTDSTRQIIREVTNNNRKVKAIFNTRNFGQFNSPYYGMLQTSGDCTIFMCADFQEPVEMIPKFITEWEKGYKIVVGKKTTSRENKVIYFLRSVYYKMIKKFSDIEQIEHFTGFGLYDRTVIDALKKIKDSMPFLRGIIAELGFNRKEIEYEQQLRRAGKTKNNFFTLYDAAMISFTSYTKIGLRAATFVGFFVALLCFFFAVFYLVMKLIYWDRFIAGTAPLLLGMLFIGAIILVFLGLLGEYIMSINIRVMNRPLVIEEERINFE